jgi:hypothetical protein
VAHVQATRIDATRAHLQQLGKEVVTSLSGGDIRVANVARTKQPVIIRESPRPLNLGSRLNWRRGAAERSEFNFGIWSSVKCHVPYSCAVRAAIFRRVDVPQRFDAQPEWRFPARMPLRARKHAFVCRMTITTDTCNPYVYFWYKTRSAHVTMILLPSNSSALIAFSLFLFFSLFFYFFLFLQKHLCKIKNSFKDVIDVLLQKHESSLCTLQFCVRKRQCVTMFW